MTTTGPTTTGTTMGNGSSAEVAKGAASDVASEATQAATDVKETAKTEVRSVVSDATEKAGEVMRTTQDELRSQVTAQTKNLSSTLDDIARQLSSMADSADDPDSPVAQLAHTAADQIRRQGQRLDEGGLEEIVSDVKRFARNRPGAFLLGTVAAGFAVGRLAKHADLKRTVDQARSELTNARDQGSSGQGGTLLPSRAAVAPPATGAMPPSTGTTASVPATGATATGADTTVFDTAAPGGSGERL
jgi:hypothetical protein